MIKTYLYGTPHGFDFYEKELAFSDYFKGFYISSRSGKRLVVNRREDGTTIYSFLHYGLMEVGGRPNSFFGMSLIMDEGRYTPDFQQMFKWFEYIFEKLLERGIIFKKNEAGTIQYRIDKLEEASEDVEWVKANLPKIFSQEAATRILYYDNSFTQGQAGKVACFNDEESEKNLLTAFREFRWIILSPGFEKSIELNAGELKERLGELNGKLAPIATQVAIGNWKGSENDLGQMRREAENACVNIDKYLSSIRDEEERKTFSELLSRYKEFCGNIHQLQYTLLKQNQSTPGTIENRKTEEAEKRKEAKSQIEENKEQETTYINEKWNNQFPPTSNISGEQIVKLKKYGLIGGSVLLLLCLVGMFAFNDKQERATVSDKTTASLNDSHKDEHWVDSKVFNDYINNNAIADAYNYLKDKENKSDYIFQLKNSIKNYLWELIIAPNSSQETVAENLMDFYINNKEILDFVKFTNEDEDWWNQLNANYHEKRDSASQIKLVRFMSDGVTRKDSLIIRSSTLIGREYYVGEYVDFYYPGIGQMVFDKCPFDLFPQTDHLRIRLTVDTLYVFRVGGKEITITAKTNTGE